MTPNSLPGASSRVKAKAFTALLSLLVLLTMVLAACGASSSLRFFPMR